MVSEMTLGNVEEHPLGFNTKLLVKSLLGKDDPVILEIGCNDGSDTQEFLDTFPGIRLYCFEPDPRAALVWKKRINDPRATLIEAAVGKHDGTTSFHLSSGIDTPDGRPWDLSSSIRRPTAHLEHFPEIKFEEDVEVSIVTLDRWGASVYPGLNAIDFIWADVQGAEGDLIGGAREILDRTWYFFTEAYEVSMYEGQPPQRELIRLLPNFRVLAKVSDNLLFKRWDKPGPSTFSELVHTFRAAGVPEPVLEMFSEVEGR